MIQQRAAAFLLSGNDDDGNGKIVGENREITGMTGLRNVGCMMMMCSE